MNRQQPLRRKTSLFRSFTQKMKREAEKLTVEGKQNGQRNWWRCKVRKPLKKISRSHRDRLKLYFTARNEFLSLPQNAACAICLCLGQIPMAATEVHHKFGRVGTLLFDARGFIPSCRMHREWPHQNQREARALGLLGEAWEWGVPIDRQK